MNRAGPAELNQTAIDGKVKQRSDSKWLDPREELLRHANGVIVVRRGKPSTFGADRKDGCLTGPQAHENTVSTDVRRVAQLGVHGQFLIREVDDSERALLDEIGQPLEFGQGQLETHYLCCPRLQQDSVSFCPASPPAWSRHRRDSVRRLSSSPAGCRCNRLHLGIDTAKRPFHHPV